MNKRTIFILMCLIVCIFLFISFNFGWLYFLATFVIFLINLFLFWKWKIKISIIIFILLLILFSIIFAVLPAPKSSVSKLEMGSDESNHAYVCDNLFANTLPSNWSVNTPQAKPYKHNGATLTQVCEFDIKNNFEISVNKIKGVGVDTYAEAYIKGKGSTWNVDTDKKIALTDSVCGRYLILKKSNANTKNDVKREVFLLFPYDNYAVGMFYPVKNGQSVDDDKILKGIKNLNIND